MPSGWLEASRTPCAPRRRRRQEGYAERMELEEAIRLEKWKENVPMMTIEGQPLSENVKKRRRRGWSPTRPRRRRRTAGSSRTRAASTTTRRSRRSTGDRPHRPGLPRRRGAAGTQPEVYTGGGPRSLSTARRRDAAAADGVDVAVDALQERFRGGGDHPGGGLRQPLVHLRAQHRRRQPRQLDRIFFGEHDEAQGFFVCKFYQDDPLSDDDWQVVLVDDRIPCDAAGKCPAFCRNPDPNVFWAMIVEKAYAKMAAATRRCRAARSRRASRT